MLVKNKKTKKSKKKYPKRAYSYMSMDLYARLYRVRTKTGKSISNLIREGCEYICDKYERE